MRTTRRRDDHAPTPLFDTFIPVDNPFIPDDLKLLLDSRPDPSDDVVFYRRLSELGPRVGRETYDVYQATLGVSGDFSMAGSTRRTCRSRTNDRKDQ